MATFAITDKEVHALIKLMGVAFHSIANNLQPKQVTFTLNEIEQMFKVHNGLYHWIDDMQNRANDELDKELQ